MSTRKLISVITPCFNEEENIQDCYDAIKELFATKLKDYDYEHIFCDNASEDNTVKELERVAAQDSRVKVIINANNFGFLRSMFNGVLAAKGDAVIPMMPADLQDPPELIPTFVDYWEKGYKVVYGQRDKRDEPFLIETGRKLYYKFVTRFSKAKIPVDAGEFQLIDRKVVDALKLFDDYEPYLRGMIAQCGFKSIGVKYFMKAREKGVAKGRFFLLFDLALNGIVSNTTVPIRVGLVIGFLMSILSLAYAAFLLALFLFNGRSDVNKGMASVMIGLFLLSGIQLFFIALVGEYVASIHAQVRKGPLVVEDRRINF
ncbi:glycosyltransferase family 2 protein [Bdellovibrio sp. NC01]|uniref:glycosyltransferase family 2 protein n=1 Tax=Bdellovibrio sp. NC01 TaxID=2220073 RepID=UPI0011592DE2|nr:glycosyltransferase family 2 protein [Bdellovibrio sp. NC01]QDK37497.1 glycosyltransferase [Bdellovibrio sp. NC01]